jgi:hypothetical protein
LFSLSNKKPEAVITLVARHIVVQITCIADDPLLGCSRQRHPEVGVQMKVP